MRFTKVKIDNFYNLKEVDLDLTKGNTLIVGPNGAGKTNIIKSIQFLVNQILISGELEQWYHLKTRGIWQQHGFTHRDLPSELPMDESEPKIWNPNEKDCHVKLHAQFNKTEVELFSELRVLSLMADVCYVVCAITGLLMDEAADRVQPFINLHGTLHILRDPGKSDEFIKSLMKDEERIFSDLPEATLLKIINTSFRNNNGSEVFLFQDFFQYSKGSVQLDTPCVAALVVEVTNKLFPKLLEITKRALSEWHDTPCPVKGPDHVLMAACTHETVGRLDYSVDVSDDAWLPAKQPKYKEEECTVICSALQDVFGELKSIECSFWQFSPVQPFYEAVQILPGINYECVEMRPRVKKVCKYSRSNFGWTVNELVHRLHGVMKYTPWGILFSRCLGKLQMGVWPKDTSSLDKKYFFQYAAIHCLRRSTINCILPQVRGVAMKNGAMSFTVNLLEQQLIKSKLSEDDVVQRQFSKVKDGMKSFCGIKIHVMQREGAVVQDNEKEAEKIIKLGCELQSKDRVALLEIGHRLSYIGHEMTRKAPSWSGDLHVMLTRTQRNETSTYSHRTSLYGLSGGEIEILMVLCAIHLSGADTVFLDEPGHSLHPPQQAQLSRWIETLQHPDPVCVVITHSVEFISRKSLNSLYHMSFTGRGFTPYKLSVDSEGGEQQPVPMEESSTTRNDVVLSKEMLNMLMRPDMRKMFFASGLYFVEGETDKLVLSTVRHHLLKDARNTKEKSMDVRELLQAVQVLEMDQWDILALGGCAEAVKAYRAAAELKIPCAIVLDLDTITVKHGKKMEPFTSMTWENSRLHKELTKERQRNSLEVAATLLDKVKSVFPGAKKNALNETRTILQEHGIWIWEGDLESVVCDNPAARQQLRTSECFMEALGEDLSVLHVSGREQMPAKDALNDYDERIFIPMRSFVDKLSTALDTARHRRLMNPSQSVTEDLKQIVGEIYKHCNQRLSQHDRFCQKGTKRTADWKASEVGTSERPLLDPPHQLQAHRSSEVMVLEDKETAADGGDCSSTQPSINEDLEKMFWDRVKNKLHEGGWMKLPWETLCEVVEVCLKADTSPLQDFCRFMKKWQCKGKGKMKATDLSRSLLSKLFASIEEDTED